MHLLNREAGTSGSGASSLSSSLLTSLGTPSPSSDATAAALTTATHSTGTNPNSAVTATPTPSHRIQPPPDPAPKRIVAAVTVASVLFFLGFVAGIWYLFYARSIRKRDEREARLSPKVKEALVARRRARASRPWKERLGDLLMELVGMIAGGR